MYRVLIIDDEPPFIRIIKKMISRDSGDFEVVGEAYNGIEALEEIPRPRPDVIFADIKMPGMDGITLLKKVYEEYPDILPVIVSGYKDFEYAREALKTGALEYILKPIDPALMSSEVLQKLATKLDFIYHNKQKEMLLDKICNRAEASGDIKLYFNYRSYLALVMRNGALSNRHGNSIFNRQYELFKDSEFADLGRICGYAKH